VTILINNNEYNKVIIPAYNEGKAIANVINEILTMYLKFIVISNKSTDNTTQWLKCWSHCLSENNKGYGLPLLKGLIYCCQEVKPTNRFWMVITLTILKN
jgi:glycosyltransferase involved in cell wall biosynthesis